MQPMNDETHTHEEAEQSEILVRYETTDDAGNADVIFSSVSSNHYSSFSNADTCCTCTR
jgi:hypothetical protein